jgi:hypothetical protein
MRSALVSTFRTGATTLLALGAFAACSAEITDEDVPTPGDDVVVTPGDDVVAADNTNPPMMDVRPGVDTPLPPTDTPMPPRDVPVPTDGSFTPGTCGVSGAVSAHVAAMSTMGWSAVNRTRGMMMYGCAGATRPQDCLATVPLADATNIGANRSAIAAAHLRVMFRSSDSSNYWTRSSADGRFVGRGTHVHDFVRSAEVEANGASYDSGFFPDNSAFVYQPGSRTCPMSMLTTGSPSSISITGCANTGLALYEHLGAALGGGDYWATSAGSAAWDDGGHSATLTETPRNEPWTASVSMNLNLMANTGSGFSSVGSTHVTTPFQGDAVISPSSRLVITRYVTGGSGTYAGYVLHQLNATHTGSAVTASLTEIARYCTVGAKPAFSFDERWVVYHHYIGGGAAADADARDRGFSGMGDAGFAPYRSQGASDIYLLDLRTGVRTRVTTMGPGQYALYPHFRSDGWIYFIIRTPASASNEYIVASDAALLLP